MRKAEFCFIVLTRGYSWKKKYKYLRLIQRNRAIYRLIKDRNENFDHTIFHEGNLSFLDILGIRFFSFPMRIKFVNVKDNFQLGKKHVWSGESKESLGYSLMCRFQYYGIWKLVRNYKKIIRVDEDCILESLPLNMDEINFAVGLLSPETHSQTNNSLIRKLAEMNLEGFYDHRFPYTNVYIADVQIWNNPRVQGFLKWIADDPFSLEHRWGDLPVLGVAAKAFSIWDNTEDVRTDLKYFHGSHNIRVN